MLCLTFLLTAFNEASLTVEQVSMRQSEAEGKETHPSNNETL